MLMHLYLLLNRISLLTICIGLASVPAYDGPGQDAYLQVGHSLPSTTQLLVQAHR
jgi:hypothetical protein